MPQCGQKQHCGCDSLLTIDHNIAVPVLGCFEDNIARVVDPEVVSLPPHHVLGG